MSTQIVTSPLTDKLMQDFAFLISRGNYYTVACKALHIEYNSFNRWMRMGKHQTEGIYRQFYELVMQADSQAEVYAVEAWRGSFDKDWRASKEFLARRHPDRWGERKHITIEVERAVETMLRELQKRLDPEVFSIVVTEIIAIGREKEAETAEIIDGQ